MDSWVAGSCPMTSDPRTAVEPAPVEDRPPLGAEVGERIYLLARVVGDQPAERSTRVARAPVMSHSQLPSSRGSVSAMRSPSRRSHATAVGRPRWQSAGPVATVASGHAPPIRLRVGQLIDAAGAPVVRRRTFGPRAQGHRGPRRRHRGARCRDPGGAAGRSVRTARCRDHADCRAARAAMSSSTVAASPRW